MNSTFDFATDIARGIFKIRRYPGLAIVILGLMGAVTYFSIEYFSTGSHLRKAKKLYASGNFAGAVTEAEAYLSEEPEAIDGLDMLADAHAALAELSRGSTEKYTEHLCAAINTYKKRLDLRFNNNISTKMVLLEEQNQGLVDSEGRLYGGCEDSETRDAETRP